MEFRTELFWDVDPETIDTQKHAPYIIERVLDYGTDEEVRWVWETYSKERIKEVIDNTRGIRPRTKALWSLLLT